MKLALIFDKTREDTTGIYFERACQSLQIPYDHWWLRDREQIPAEYDLYLRVDHGDDYTVSLPDRLRPAIFYAIDTHLPHSWSKIRRAAPQYDVVFCAQVEAAHRLRNGAWLPLASDPEHVGAPAAESTWDVGFVGTDGGVPRKFYLQALRERYRNSSIGRGDYTTLASIYSRCRIGFNYSIANDVNMRIFEILAAPTLLVTNALEGDAFHQLGLEDRKHLVLYRSPKELFELIEHFLAHPDERRQVAQAGHRVVMERHTYGHRLQRLLARAADQLAVP